MSQEHPYVPTKSFDGGDLDCGNGLLLLIRRHIDPMESGQLLEIRSTESSVIEDLPAWCRLTGNDLLSVIELKKGRSFLVSKGKFQGASSPVTERTASLPRVGHALALPIVVPAELPKPVPAPSIEPLSVMGIGSWPRPTWLLRSLHEHLKGRISEDEFQSTADDAVRLAVGAQESAGVDVITDGEQRRDAYASFVGARLVNCQLVPMTDLLPLVEDPEEFADELRALDVPMTEVRHPVVYGRLGRDKPFAVHELEFVKTLTNKPVKIALPGPYLLTRTFWLECLRERAYQTREELAKDVARVLREEAHALLAKGATLVQFDEPVLTEVVFTGPKSKRSFMCGALSEKGSSDAELGLAQELMQEVTRGLPKERLAIHICRGNWTKDEGALLQGDYRPLLSFLARVPVGTLFLEMSTPRAGELALLRELPDHLRIGVGILNPRLDHIETEEELLPRIDAAIQALGRERVLLASDCGFATFADNPVASADAATRKLRAAVNAARSRRPSSG